MSLKIISITSSAYSLQLKEGGGGKYMYLAHRSCWELYYFFYNCFHLPVLSKTNQDKIAHIVALACLTAYKQNCPLQRIYIHVNAPRPVNALGQISSKLPLICLVLWHPSMVWEVNHSFPPLVVLLGISCLIHTFLIFHK